MAFKFRLHTRSGALRFVALSLIVLACSQRASREEVVMAYEASSNSHDIDSLLALYADDIRVEKIGMGPPLEGKEALRDLAEYDAALRTTLAVSLGGTGKDTLFCRIVETNDWLETVGLMSIQYDPVYFVIRGGKIEIIRAELSQESIESVNKVMSSLLPWARENYQGELESMMPSGVFTYDKGSAEKILMLASRWREKNFPVDHRTQRK